MSVPVDLRVAADFEATLRARVPGYLPGWEPVDGSAAGAVLSIAARLNAVVADRLNRAPVKNELAFLDMLGISLLTAQPARAPMAFALRPGLGDSRAAAGTQVGASVAGVTGPLIFETERDIALASAPLVQVATVSPDQDGWVDHTAAYTSHQPFTLFAGLGAIGHELYLAHDVHFALDGHCEVQVQLELANAASTAIDTAWEYWDGTGWRPFAAFADPASATDADSIDGTAGLRRSGTVVLRVEGAAARSRTVNGVLSYWIRARTTRALTPDFAPHLPTVDAALIRSVIAPPIGSLALYRDDGTGTILGPYDSLTVDFYNIWSLSPDAAAATVTLVQLDAPDSKPPVQIVRSLSSGTATVKATAANEGDWELHVAVPGYISALGKVSLSTGGLDLPVIVVPKITDRSPDKGATASLPLDLTKPFYPFGPSPLPGSAFYLASADAFSKPRAKVTLSFDPVATGLNDASSGVTPITPNSIDAQYYDGTAWKALTISYPGLPASVFSKGGTVQFVVPDDIAPATVNNVAANWIRFLVADLYFGQSRPISFTDAKGNTTSFVTHEVIAPSIARVGLSYYYASDQDVPVACHTSNDFAWVDHSAALAARGAPFAPFTVSADRTPALYLGFDGPLPTDVVSIYADIEEVVGEESGPILVWECYDDGLWVAMSVEDETGALALPGMVRLAYPGVTPLPSVRGIQSEPASVSCSDASAAGRLRAGDHVIVGDDRGSEQASVASVDAGVIAFANPTAKVYPRAQVTKAGLPRFGTPLASWVRARLRSDGDPRSSVLDGVYANAVWAAQVQTRTNEVLGTSDGNPQQSLTMHYPPVLPGEVIEVLELSGARAGVDYATLRDDVLAHGGSDADLRAVRDSRTGAVTQVWVRWAEQRNLYFSGSGDRHYTIERSSGLVQFGDDLHGRIPPTAIDGIHAAVYRSGGGRVGNVAAGAINQLLSGVPAGSVVNIRAAEGGADTETAADVLSRGPGSVAARSQATTAADYETLAREASPAVALARAMPATDPTGRPQPGYVRLIVMPDSAESRPTPSFGLRRQVEDYVRLRCPASMAGQVYVVGPDYQPVGVYAEIDPLTMDAAGPTIEAAIAAATRFLHPLFGGPDRTGWAFGRDVYLSDLAHVIGDVPGVDRVPTLELLLDGAPHGQVVTIPAGRIVVAGTITIRLAGRP